MANVGVWTPEANEAIAGMRSPLVGFAQFPQGPYSSSIHIYESPDSPLNSTNCTECALYFCVNTYETLVRTGQL